MTQAEVAEAQAYTADVAEQATPGVTGDLAEVVGDTLDSGRHDLAAAAEEQLVADAAYGKATAQGTASRLQSN